MTRRIRIAQIALAAAVAPLAIMGAASAADPSGNTSPSGLYNCPVNSSAISSSCLSGAVSDFNKARAKEGLGPLNLPTNFTRLSVPMQVLTLTDIDRADRGLPPIAGLNTTLNAYAAQGNAHQTDPPFPSWTGYGSGNWVSSPNSLWGEFEWMYDDGLGSGNMDCTSTNTSGCWGHRHNIIMNWPAPLVMGASSSSNGIATLTLGGDTHDAVNGGTWDSEAPYFNKRTTPKWTSAYSDAAHWITVRVSGVSQTRVVLQHLVNGVWKFGPSVVSPGSVANNFAWGWHVYTNAPGTFRVVTYQNSRFVSVPTAWIVVK